MIRNVGAILENELQDFEKMMQSLRSGGLSTLFIIWREEDSFNLKPCPLKIDVPCIFVCKDGELEIEINLKRHTLKKGGMLCFTTVCACRILRCSDDYRSIGIMFSRTLWHRLVFSENVLGQFVAHNPMVDLTDDEMLRLVRFHELLCLCSDSPDVPDVVTTLLPIVMGMVAQLRAISMKRKDRQNSLSGKEKIMCSFLELLHMNCRQSRKVEFYADELNLSPRHFSTVVKEISGYSASYWIDKYVLLEAQILLINTTMPIKGIAYMLNFNDQSLFSKYFSRLMGCSPESYRRSRRLQLDSWELPEI